MLRILFYSTLVIFAASFILFGVITQIYLDKIDAEGKSPFHNPNNPDLKTFNILKWLSFLRTTEGNNPVKKLLLVLFYTIIGSAISLVILLFNSPAIFR
jgi:hypothetical protein